MIQSFIIAIALIASFAISLPTTDVHYVAKEEHTPEVVLIEEKSQLHPELVPICACESSYEGTRYGKPQQFETDGITVRYGRANNKDRGMCMINQDYWLDTANDLGFDIETEEGNINMANWIYEHHGTKPWGWSAPCHGK